MKTYAPSYYKDFKCIAGSCRHTCCVGWEIDVDGDSLPRFLADPEIAPHIETWDTPKIRLSDGERCPFLRDDGLCKMILGKGEEFLCQICRDHPRFRNYWTDRVEVGLGLVCEEAARLILSKDEPMRLVEIDGDGSCGTDGEENSPEENRIICLRNRMLSEITETGPRARLLEYLIYRHMADAVYDGMENERIRFIYDSFREITEKWDKTDGSIGALVETVRLWSYDTEYDDEVISDRLFGYSEI